VVRLDAKSGGFPVLVLMGAVLAFVCSAEEKVTGISLYPEGHLGWASSLAGGGIKGEVWVSDKGVLDAGELLRQVEIEGGIRVIHSLAEESDSQRLNVIAKLDVLICSDAAWLGLTDSERLAVHERVGKGMGLVLIDLEESKVFDVEKVRWEVVDLPQVLEAEYSMPLREGVRNEVGSWETYGAESGRIAVFQGHFQPDMQKLVPYDFAEEIEPSLLYEYHLASLIRAILWVSQRKSQLSITGIERARPNVPDAREIPPQLTPEFTQYMLDQRMKTVTQVITVQFDRPAQRNYDVFIRVRQPLRASSWSYEAGGVRKGKTEKTLHVLVGKGESWIDLWIMRGTDVVDWHSYRVAMDEWPNLSDVQFSKWLVQRSDSVEVTFSVGRNSRRPAPTYAFFVVSDSFGRVLTESRVVIYKEGGDVKANVSWTDALTLDMKLEVYLSDVRVERLTSGSRKYSSYASTALIVEQPLKPGLQWIVKGSTENEAWRLSVNKSLSVLGADSIDVVDSLSEGQGGVDANLSSVSHLDILSRRSDAGDLIREPCLTSLEFRQDLYAAFKNWTGWARSRGIRYADLSANPSISSDLGVYCDSVTCRRYLQSRLQSYYPNLELLNTNWNTRFSSWQDVRTPFTVLDFSPVSVDMQRIRNETDIGAYKEARDQMLDHRSTLKTGISLAHGGTISNLSEWIPEFDLLSIPPDQLLMEKVRSYRRMDASTVVRLPEKNSNASRRLLWNSLYHGMTAVWTGGVGEDGQVSEDTILLGEAIYPLRQGIDVLLQSAEPVPASVAIYENSASLYVSSLEERSEITNVQTLIVRTLEGLGLGYDFVSYSKLMETGLSGYGVLILPHVRALSAEEDALIGQFIVDGGTLITDGIAGEVDEHGAARQTSSKAIEAALQISFSEEGDGRDGLDAAIRDAEVPRLYPELTNAGKSTGSFEWFRYRYGKAELVGILAGEGALGRTPSMRFPEGRAVYDVLEGKQLKTSKAGASLNEAGAGLICVLPYRVSRIVADVPEIVQSGHRLHYSMQIKTFDALPGDHWVHVKLLDEAGRSIRYYESTIDCAGGVGEGYIPLALNEKPGQYTLVIRDVMTGVMTSKRIEIV